MLWRSNVAIPILIVRVTAKASSISGSRPHPTGGRGISSGSPRSGSDVENVHAAKINTELPAVLALGGLRSFLALQDFLLPARPAFALVFLPQP